MASHPKTAWTGILGDYGSNVGVGLRRRAPGPVGLTVGEAIANFLAAARQGLSRDRYERVYGDEAVEELTWALSGYVAEQLGDRDLGDVHRRDVEELVYDLGAAGLTRVHLRMIVKSVRALFDFAIANRLVDANPAERIALPDENDAEQPNRRRAKRPRLRLDVDRVIGAGLQLASICFVLLALFFLAESL
jgi:hypothetical protein